MNAIAALLVHGVETLDAIPLRRMQRALSLQGHDRQDHRLVGRCGLVSLLTHGFTPEDTLERQPLLVKGRWHMVFAGWISNREDTLRTPGIPPKEWPHFSDSAVMAIAWERWETDTTERLDGSFSVIVWDAYKSSLFAARSIGSTPPSRYHHTAARTALATTPKGLFALGDVPRTSISLS